MGLIIALISVTVCIFIFVGLIRYTNKCDEYEEATSSNRDSDLLKPQSSDLWYEGYYELKELPTLPFEKFKNFYFINPDTWDLRKGVAYKEKNHKNISAIAFRPYSNYVKYEKFRKEIKQEQEKAHIDKTQTKLLTIALESVQTDINDLKEKANKEYEEARKLARERVEKFFKECKQKG